MRKEIPERFQLALAVGLLTAVLAPVAAGAVTILPPNSATSLDVVAFYNGLEVGIPAISQSANMYSQSRVDSEPAYFTEYESAYDIAARQYGMQMELVFDLIFARDPNTDPWEDDLQFLRDRFQSGDHLVGLTQVVGPDEPYHSGWGDKAKLETALALLKQYFPDARTRVNFVNAPAEVPANLDIVSTTYYPFLTSSRPNQATFKAALIAKVQAFRDAGFTQPMQIIGQCHEDADGSGFDMPTPEELIWYYEVAEDPCNAGLNITGLLWYGWYWNPGLQFIGVGQAVDPCEYVGQTGTPLFPTQLDQLSEIATAVGPLPAPPAKARWVIYDGSVEPNDPWIHTDTGGTTDSSDGKIYTIETPYGTTRNYWRLEGPSAWWHPKWAHTTVQSRLRFKGNGSAEVGVLGMFTGSNGLQYLVKFVDEYEQDYFKFAGGSDQGSDVKVKILSGKDTVFGDNFDLSNGTPLEPNDIFSIEQVPDGQGETLILEHQDGQLKIGAQDMVDTSRTYLRGVQTAAKDENGEVIITMKFRFPGGAGRNAGTFIVSPDPFDPDPNNHTSLEYSFSGFGSRDHYLFFYENGIRQVELNMIDLAGGALLADTDYMIRFRFYRVAGGGGDKVAVYFSRDGGAFQLIINSDVPSYLLSDPYHVSVAWSGREFGGTTWGWYFVDYVIAEHQSPRFNVVQLKRPYASPELCDVYLPMDPNHPAPVITGWQGYGLGATDLRWLFFGDNSVAAGSGASGRIEIDYIAWTNGADLGPDPLVLPTELDQKLEVNMGDLALFVDAWLSTGPDLPEDVNNNQHVDLPDFTQIGTDWYLY